MSARQLSPAEDDDAKDGALLPGSPLQASPSYYFQTLGARISVQAERNVRKLLDLGLMEWRVIQLVGYEPGASPTRLTALTGVNKANISRAVAGLEARGLIQRKAASGHARHIQLSLTPDGRRVHKRGNEMRARYESEMLAGLSPAIRVELCAHLRRILRNLDRMEEDS